MPGTRGRNLDVGETPWWAANKCISLAPTRFADSKRRVNLKVSLLDSWTLRRFVDTHCRGREIALDPWRPTVALTRRMRPTNDTKNSVPSASSNGADTILLSPYNATHHLHFSIRTPRKTEVIADILGHKNV